MAEHYAVLGSPISHSKSPAIHAGAYAFLKLDWDYSRYEVDTQSFAKFMDATTLDGFSLTMPLKDIAYKSFETADEAATLAKAVNTLVRADGSWQGFNTDVFGLERALAGVSAESVLVLGSGATARNAAIAISRILPTATLTICARNQTTAQLIVEFARALGLEATTTQTPVDLAKFDLTISTLPPQSSVANWFTGKPNGTFFDVAYNPWPSEMAKTWALAGCNVISGLEMLIWQAIAQIRIFKNGNVAEPLENERELAEVMRNAALAEG